MTQSEYEERYVRKDQYIPDWNYNYKAKKEKTQKLIHLHTITVPPESAEINNPFAFKYAKEIIPLLCYSILVNTFAYWIKVKQILLSTLELATNPGCSLYI